MNCLKHGHDWPHDKTCPYCDADCLETDVFDLTHEVLRSHDEVERLTAEGSVLLTAIAEIAGQKLCHEMSMPDDGDYRFAYEEIIRVARLASDAVSGRETSEQFITAEQLAAGIFGTDWRNHPDYLRGRAWVLETFYPDTADSRQTEKEK